MSNVALTNVLRFLGLVLIQVLVLKRVALGGSDFNYISIIVYPLFLILLPLRTPHSLLVLIGFVLGLTVDAFYGSYGVHASASVFTGFIRPYVLQIVEPKGGYNINYSPTKHRFGINWFIIYAASILLLHLFFYFSVDAFTFYYISDIFIRTVSSFLISMILVIIYQYIFDPIE